MAILSPARDDFPIYDSSGTLELIHRGKVRDAYRLENGRILFTATDGISIFDFVLNALVPDKGRVLTGLSHFWLEMLSDYGIPTHFLAAGLDMDQYLPEDLHDNLDLHSRSMVVQRLAMDPVEFIIRGCLTGSGFDSYSKTGQVKGFKLPSGMQDGDLLPFPLDTPTTKAEEGHDLALDPAQIRAQYPAQTYRALQIFQVISAYARQRGIMFADTKFEFSGEVVGDEVGTPDSSRFWNYDEWLKIRQSDQRSAPPPFDKQLVREWGKAMGIHKLDPSKTDDVAKVHAMQVPRHLITATTNTYRYIFWRLTGRTVEDYFSSVLGVDLPWRRYKVVVVLGSTSDYPQLEKIIANYGRQGQIAEIDVHIISCHRNPAELAEWVNGGCGKADVIIGAGSKALALPGVIDAFVYAKGLQIPVIGVALGEPGTVAFEAARLSIEELPSQPVLIDELAGVVYCGSEGFARALNRVAFGELPPAKSRKSRVAQWGYPKAPQP